jgi:opacity protein-like surface antigen
VTTGLGTDVALTSNLFVRGEFEYIFFAPVNGIQVSMWSARVGAGVKF